MKGKITGLISGMDNREKSYRAIDLPFVRARKKNELARWDELRSAFWRDEGNDHMGGGRGSLKRPMRDLDLGIDSPRESAKR